MPIQTGPTKLGYVKTLYKNKTMPLSIFSSMLRPEILFNVLWINGSFVAAEILDREREKKTRRGFFNFGNKPKYGYGFCHLLASFFFF